MSNNAAAMREALEELVNHHCRNCPEDTQYGCGVNIGGLLGFKCTLLKQARAALSASARNCDKMPDIDNLTMHDLANSPCKSTLENASCEELLALVRWLLAPAAELKGEDDGR